MPSPPTAPNAPIAPNLPTDELLLLLRAAGRAGVPVLLWGTPGIGKSELVEQLGRLDGVPTEVVIGSLREPADLNGLPVVQPDGTVHLAPPAWARRLADAGGGYLFLDELSTAAPSVQAAMLRVAKDRVVGDLALPTATRVIAAANPIDVSAGGWDLEPPTANRFLHVEHQPDFEAWAEGMAAGFEHVLARRDTAAMALAEATDDRVLEVTAKVVGFLHTRSHHFNRCPTDAASAGHAWPSPRTWDLLRRVLVHLPDERTGPRLAAATGLVGHVAGTELVTWLRHADLPDPAHVLDGIEPFDPHDRDDRVFAVLVGVAGVATRRGTAQDWEAAWDVVARARVDLAAVAARNLFRARPADAAIPEVVADFAPILRRAGMVAA